MSLRLVQRRGRWLSYLWALGAFAFLGMETVAEADFINGRFGFTGTTDANGALDSTLNVAVLNRANGVDGDIWHSGSNTLQNSFVAGIDRNGAASPGLDTGANFLFLYQVINNGTGADPIRRTLINRLRALTNRFGDPTTITSWGYFTNHGFSDSQGDVSANPRPIGNPLGAVPNVPTIFDGVLRADNQVAMEMPSVVMRNDTYVDPGTVQLNYGARGSLDVLWGALSPVGNAQASSLFGFTVRIASISEVPFRFQGSDPDARPAFGRTLGIVPAPPSLVLALIGFAGLGLGRSLHRLHKRS